MQGLNITKIEEKIVEINSETCKHQPVYFGAVNINLNERTIGSIDVWRCGVCKKKFCEEKQLGIESITDIVGMPKIEPDEKWCIIVSKFQTGKDKWKLTKIKESGSINFETVDEKIIELKIKNFEIENNLFKFTAIAFGRIGGQNVGVKISKTTEKSLEKLGYDVEKVIMTLQKNLLEGNLSLPEGLKRDTFVDD